MQPSVQKTTAPAAADGGVVVCPIDSASSSLFSPAELSALVTAFYATANDPQHATLAQLHQQLQRISQHLSSSSSSTFLSYHYVSLSQYLLSRFATDWLPAFTPQQRGDLFDPFFSAAIPPSYVHLALVSALRSAPPPSASSLPASTSTVVSLLTAFFREGRVAALFQELSASSTASSPLPARAQLCIDSLASLPDVAANRLQRELPASLAAVPLFSAVLERVAPLLSSPSPPVAAFSAFLSRLSRLSHARLAMQALLPPVLASLQAEQAEEKEEQDGQTRASVSDSAQALSDVILSVNPSALEATVEGLLSQLGRYAEDGSYDGQRLQRVLPALFSSALTGQPVSPFSSSPLPANVAMLRVLLTNKFLLTRPLPPSASSLLLRCLCSLSYPPAASASPCEPILPLFDNAVVGIARLWSSSAFFLSSPPASVSAVTASLLTALSLLAEQQPAVRAKREGDEGQPGAFASHPAMHFVMEGVQTRMADVESGRRRDGLRAAVAMSRVMDPTQPLQFDELDEEDTRAEEQRRRQREAELRKQQEMEKQQRLREEEDRRRQLQSESQAAAVPELDPDAAWDPAVTAVTSAWTEETEAAAELPTPASGSAAATAAPVIVEDDSDLRKVPLPRYLRDVLDYLRKQEEGDHIKAALSQVEALVRSRPFDLPDLAAELCGALQQVATTVYCEDAELDLQRKRGLLAVVVCCPDVAAGRLLQSFYGQSLTLMGKLEVLELLTQAAEELSGQTIGSSAQSAQQRRQKTTTGTVAPLPALQPSLPPVAPAASDSRQPMLKAGSEAGALLTKQQHDAIVAARVESKTRR